MLFINIWIVIDILSSVKWNLYNKLEIPALRVFLGADAQLLGISLASARMPLVYVLSSYV